jgi:PKD repeat protein
MKIKFFIGFVFAFCAILSNVFAQEQSLKGVQNTTSSSPVIISIQDYLLANSEELDISIDDVSSWEVTDDYYSGNGAIHHVYLGQTINGKKLFNGTANITLNRANKVLKVASNLVSNIGNRYLQKGGESISPYQAVLSAKNALGINGNPGAEITSNQNSKFRFKKGDLSREDIDVSSGLWNNGEEIREVWVVSIQEIERDHWWQMYIDAYTGKELHHIDWITNCSFHSCDHQHIESPKIPGPIAPPAKSSGTEQYHVFPFPIESPIHGKSSIVVGPSSPTASPFGWHDVNGVSGAEFTITRGNNVYAYEDTDNDNAPGFSPDGGTALDFNFPLNLNQAPTGYQSGAITNLFFINNRIHDILFEYGFDEASGNFQVTNYSGIGAGQDPVQAEAQDGGGLNNANFATPPDGSNPRMQMYLWSSGGGAANLLTVNSPASVAGNYSALEATFGPGLSTPITTDLVLFDDGQAPTDDACDPAVNGAALSGKIAVLYRGNCSFVIKVANAQAAGAIAAIVINNIGGAPIAMGGTDPSITIPSIMISDVNGATLANEMANNTVNATLVNNSTNFQKDGNFDNGIIAHEYGHGVSNRLTGGPSNSGCLGNAEQMGEGWSDFIGMMLTMDSSLTNPVYRPIGTFATSEPTNGNGIRLAPYDTSFAINDYTYGDVSNTAGVSQPHGIGFVWCTMLWDLTWALINQYRLDYDIEGGTGGNNMALHLVIEGMKLQACSPGFVDGRDAILLADQLLYGGANRCLIWKVFAKRGLGYSADQGSSSSRDDQTEAFDLPPICINPIAPPVADFDANTISTCTGQVQFQDLSTQIAQSWKWHFGDGDSSSERNPFHTYTKDGNYTVTLTVTNSMGKDVKTISNFIDVSSPDAPIGNDGYGCTTEDILLTATGPFTTKWINGIGDIVETGEELYTPAADIQATYFAYQVEEFPIINIGPADNSIGTGGYHNTGFAGALNFTAESMFIIHSAWVDAEFPGIRQVTLSKGFNTSGNFNNPIEVIDVDIPFTGPGRVELGFTVPEPGEYSIGLNNAGLYRNSTGANYPYVSPGLMTIEGSSATTAALDYYYYFYDLEVGKPGCFSDTITVSSNIESTDYEWEASILNVDFKSLVNGARTWLWDFGDGNVSNEENATHTYSKGGTYKVTLTTNGSCSVTYDVTVEEIEEIEEISLFPNPAKNETKIIFTGPLAQETEIQLFSADGKLLRHYTVPKSSTEAVLSLIGIAPQVCYLKLLNTKGQKPFELLIQ